ncbi:MAG: 6-carboxytetrahydropterin synthase [Desulfurellales bacterium]|nr:MAG: 6-carboxytetrahydropterin synthase [Desulfurellales bacterium]
MITAQRYHDISCGHRVFGHESKCAHLHGHNYRVHFTIAGDLDDVGRVLDFSAIKERLCMWLESEWDHKFLIWEEDPWQQQLAILDPKGVVWVPFNPTAENMAEYLVNVVAPLRLAGTGTKLLSCTIEETRKCSATYAIGG